MVCCACDSKSPRNVFIDGRPFCQNHGAFGETECSHECPISGKRCKSKARTLMDGRYSCLRHGSSATCSICLEVCRSKDIELTQCGHIFHKKCLETWRNTSESYSCPLCRTENIDLAIVSLMFRYIKEKDFLRAL